MTTWRALTRCGFAAPTGGTTTDCSASSNETPPTSAVRASFNRRSVEAGYGNLRILGSTDAHSDTEPSSRSDAPC